MCTHSGTPDIFTGEGGGGRGACALIQEHLIYSLGRGEVGMCTHSGTPDIFTGEGGGGRGEGYIHCVVLNFMSLPLCDDVITSAPAPPPPHITTQYMDNKSFCEDLTEGKFSFLIIHGIRADRSSKLLSIRIGLGTRCLRVYNILFP